MRNDELRNARTKSCACRRGQEGDDFRNQRPGLIAALVTIYTTAKSTEANSTAATLIISEINTSRRKR
jgi:hypothetical protein